MESDKTASDELLGCADAFEMARKYKAHGAFVRATKIGNIRVNKVFLQRCPKCFHTLPGMISNDGWEICIARKCDYARRVFSEAENRWLRDG